MTRLLQTLRARYDLAVLVPPEPVQQPPLPHDPGAWQALQAWCAAGSGPGGRPLLRPGARPPVQQRLAVAALQGPGARALARWLCLERDGSLQLLACRGAAGRLGLRLRTKLHDAMWWRQRQGADPWDSGTLRSDAAGLQALARFTPRRATLIVAQDLPPATMQAVLATLQGRCAGYPHPLRLLLLDIAPPGDACTLIRCT